jgi:hypothetical protein
VHWSANAFSFPYEKFFHTASRAPNFEPSNNPLLSERQRLKQSRVVNDSAKVASFVMTDGQGDRGKKKL